MKQLIESGACTLGIELGSTRIKAVLIDTQCQPIAQGSYEWENQLVDGLWTYSMEDVQKGMQACFADLQDDVQRQYGSRIHQLKAMGVSAMMHGYLPFDKDYHLLSAFRTWRNTNTGKAAAELSQLFGFNIPLRWSISHLYQCILDKEEHVGDIHYLTTLAGYVHYCLTGYHVLGVGDASGMLPVDAATGDYDQQMVRKFNHLIEPYHFTWQLQDLLPTSLPAGAEAGRLTEEGARWLDPTGTLQAGCPLCPPEGDAGTGMLATNAVRPRTGNVSAGTSSFSMIVLEKPLSRPYEDIDMVTTPDGYPGAMVHCNTCTSDFNAWVQLFSEYRALVGQETRIEAVYKELYNLALDGETDCGGVTAYNFFSGEPVLGVDKGHPILLREVTGLFSLANLMRAHLYAAVAPLKIGNDILFLKEHVQVDRLTGHGGLFKTPVVGQRFMAAALNTPVSVMETAGAGGAWGIALLALYGVANSAQLNLPDWLDQVVFKGNQGSCVNPDQKDVEGFNRYIQRYEKELQLYKNN